MTSDKNMGSAGIIELLYWKAWPVYLLRSFNPGSSSFRSQLFLQVPSKHKGLSAFLGLAVQHIQPGQIACGQ